MIGRLSDVPKSFVTEELSAENSKRQVLGLLGRSQLSEDVFLPSKGHTLRLTEAFDSPRLAARHGIIIAPKRQRNKALGPCAVVGLQKRWWGLTLIHPRPQRPARY